MTTGTNRPALRGEQETFPAPRPASDDALPGAHAPTRRERASQVVPLMTAGEVARMFHVDPKTVTRWAKMGRMHSIRTYGSHRRFLQAEMLYVLNPSDKNRAHLMADAATLGVVLDEGRLAEAVRLCRG